jgi:hypothetical protein
VFVLYQGPMGYRNLQNVCGIVLLVIRIITFVPDICLGLLLLEK